MPEPEHGTYVQASRSVIPAMLRVVTLAPFEPIPRVSRRELRLRPIERGVAAALRPALLQIWLELVPLAVPVHHPRFPSVPVRRTPVLVVRETALGVRALRMRLAPVGVLDGRVDLVLERMGREPSRRGSHRGPDHSSDRPADGRPDRRACH